LRAARLFAVKPSTASTDETGVLALPVDPESAIRNGPEPLVVRLDSAADECHYAAALIETWVRGGIEINRRRQRVKASDVAILYPWQQPEAALHKLCERLNSFAPAVVLDRKTPRGTLWSDSIKVLTMAGARGLQFRIVVLLWAGALPSQFKVHANGADRSLLYVAMTRAEDMLVILHSGHSAYIDELNSNCDVRSEAELR
jgi:superfamily I DNA/RNA helicase